MPFPSSTFSALLAFTLSAVAVGQPLAITYRGTSNVAAATAVDQNGATFTIAGLSGLTRRGGAGDEYLAVMDNSNKLVRLNIALNANGSIAGAAVLGGLSLSQTRDFEGAAVGPDATTIFLAEEGSPAVHEFRLVDGSWLRTLATPLAFATRRDNFGFESLTRHRLTGDLWTANEEALTVDGPPSTTAAGTTVRLLRYAAAAPARQHAYTTQPMHGSVISSARSGLSDLIALPSGKLMALERSFAFSLAGLFQTRIYELDFTGSTDISALPGLIGQPFTLVAKRLLYQGSLNNLEGLCLGPRLSSGHYALLGVIDDGDPLSVNAVVSFELSGGVACVADFNDDAVISVQDIFDFLAAYFSSAPDADINGTGGISVQDIFDFLADFFDGCV